MLEANVLCWNVAGRVARLPEQAARVAGLAADLVCLQELTARTMPLWRTALASCGMETIVSTGDAPANRRPLHVLTAARWPLEPIVVADVPWPERVLAARVEGLEIVNVHSPISQRPGLVKVLTHEAVHRHLAAAPGRALLCGDLNTPRREHPDGTVWTFARTSRGKLRPDRGERWDEAELALIRGLEPHGFRDVFRELHGPEAREISWAWQRWGGGYRLDHLIASSEVTTTSVRYLHEWREEGLSDHSPLLARIAW